MAAKSQLFWDVTSHWYCSSCQPAPLLVAFEKMGLHIVDAHFRYPGPHASDIGLLALYMLMSAVFIYLVGLGLGWVFTLLRKAVRRIAMPK